MLDRLPPSRPSISDLFRRRRVPTPCSTMHYITASVLPFTRANLQVQEVAAHLNVHLPIQEGDDSGSMTSRRKPPPPPPKTNLAAITLKNHPLSLPLPPPKPVPQPPPPTVVDDFGAPACQPPPPYTQTLYTQTLHACQPPPPPPDVDAGDQGAGGAGALKRPQAARRGGAGALGGRKIVER